MTKARAPPLVRPRRYAVPHGGREPLYRFSIGSLCEGAEGMAAGVALAH